VLLVTERSFPQRSLPDLCHPLIAIVKAVWLGDLRDARRSFRA
jgi:hypothetical protein